MTTFRFLQQDDILLDDFLRGISLFTNLSEEDLSRLKYITARVYLSQDVYLFEEQSIGRYFFVIQEGEVEIFTRSGDKELLLAVRRPGEIIGELSLLDKLPRMASARARTDTTLLLVPREEFDRLLANSPSVAKDILYTILPRWRDTEVVLRQRERELFEQSVQLEQAYQELQKVNDELERRVAERTAELMYANRLLAEYIEGTKDARVVQNLLCTYQSYVTGNSTNTDDPAQS